MTMISGGEAEIGGDECGDVLPGDEVLPVAPDVSPEELGRREGRIRREADIFARAREFGKQMHVQTLEEMQAEIHEVNVANGWFKKERSMVEGAMLMVTEVSEAVEAYRDWGMEDMTGKVSVDKALTDPLTGVVHQKPEGVGSEYADELIRLLDQCERDGIDLRAEYERKIAFNRLRGHLHGGRSI